MHCLCAPVCNGLLSPPVVSTCRVAVYVCSCNPVHLYLVGGRCPYSLQYLQYTFSPCPVHYPTCNPCFPRCCQWVPLEQARSGRIHLKLDWLNLSTDVANIKEVRPRVIIVRPSTRPVDTGHWTVQQRVKWWTMVDWRGNGWSCHAVGRCSGLWTGRQETEYVWEGWWITCGRTQEVAGVDNAKFQWSLMRTPVMTFGDADWLNQIGTGDRNDIE